MNDGLDIFMRVGAEVLEFEKKKLVLPVLALAVLLTGVYVLEDFRAEGWDERQTEQSVEAMTDLTVIFLESGHFNDSTERSAEARREQEIPETAVTEEYIQENRIKAMAGYGALQAVYSTPFYPVVPVGERGYLFRNQNSFPGKITLFSSDDGYVLSEEVYTSAAVILYRQSRIGELGTELNASDKMTLREFRQRVDEISSHGARDAEVREFILGRNSSGLESQQVSQENLTRMAVRGELKEVRAVHFLPAAVAAFTWNYLLSGVLLAVLRGARERYRSPEAQE